MISLRPYQDRGVQATRAHILAGRRRVILCLATGGGKMVCTSHIVQSARKNFDAKILCVVHRLELIDQYVKQLAKWGVTDVGVMRGNDGRTNPSAPVQVATIQTLGRRNLPPADIVLPDECHMAANNSFRRLFTAYPDAVVIGTTATPCRLDGRPLGDVFQAIEMAATYSELIKDGFIVAPRVFGIGHEPNLEGVHTRAGDFVVEELETAMLEASVVGNIVEEWKKHADGRRTIVFACTVKHSRSVVERFVAAGVRAAHLDGETSITERRDILRRLEIGELQVVSQVAVWIEGLDSPPIKCAMLCHPTKSLTRFMQSCGRILRPWNENTPADRSWQPSDGPSVVPIIIDCGLNLDRHGFPHEDRRWSLEGSAKRENEKKPTKCIKCLAYIKHYPCESCGYAPPPPPPREIVEVAQAQLEERVFTDPRKAFFDRKVEEARMKGFKPAYASAKFKDEYGTWPPFSWGQAVKNAYALDDQWQRRLVNRVADRARWKKNEEELTKPQYDTDDDFAEWARRDS